MEIEPKEAAVILRIFTLYAEGMSLTQIVKTFNEENVLGASDQPRGGRPPPSAAFSTTRSTPGAGSGTEPRAGAIRARAVASRSRSQSGSFMRTRSCGSSKAALGQRPGAAQGDAPHLAGRSGKRDFSNDQGSPDPLPPT